MGAKYTVAGKLKELIAAGRPGRVVFHSGEEVVYDGFELLPQARVRLLSEDFGPRVVARRTIAYIYG